MIVFKGIDVRFRQSRYHREVQRRRLGFPDSSSWITSGQLPSEGEERGQGASKMGINPDHDRVIDISERVVDSGVESTSTLSREIRHTFW